MEWACHARGTRCTVVLETALLGQADQIAAVRLALAAYGDFVKTSTSFGPGGATLAAVRQLGETVDPSVRLKTSGGIRTLDDALAMLEAGASRLGLSASVAVFQEARRRGGLNRR